MPLLDRLIRATALAVLLNLSLAVAAPPPADHHQQLAELYGSPFESLGANARRFFAPLDLPTVRAIVEAIDAGPLRPATDQILAAALERWGQWEGPAALTQAQARMTNHRPRLESAALAGWAETDPSAAWMAMMQICNRGADRRYQPHLLLARIADRDLALAVDLFQDLVPDRACLECSASLLAELAFQHGQLSVLERSLTQVPAGPARDALVGGYWTAFGEFDAAGALAALAQVEGEKEKAQAETALCSGWASRGFSECLDYILTRPSTDQSRLLLAAVDRWANGAVAEDVAEIIKRLPSPMDERALLGVAGALGAVNPRATVTWIEEQPESPVQLESLSRVLEIWSRTEGDAAGAYVASVAFSEKRGRLTWTYLLVRTHNHSLTIEDLALLDERFAPAWVARLLEQIAIRLIDPSANARQFFNLDEFRAFVEQRPGLPDEAQQRILATLRPRS